MGALRDHKSEQLHPSIQELLASNIILVADNYLKKYPQPVTTLFAPKQTSQQAARKLKKFAASVMNYPLETFIWAAMQQVDHLDRGELQTNLIPGVMEGIRSWLQSLTHHPQELAKSIYELEKEIHFLKNEKIKTELQMLIYQVMENALPQKAHLTVGITLANLGMKGKSWQTYFHEFCEKLNVDDKCIMKAYVLAEASSHHYQSLAHHEQQKAVISHAEAIALQFKQEKPAQQIIKLTTIAAQVLENSEEKKHNLVFVRFINQLFDTMIALEVSKLKTALATLIFDAVLPLLPATYRGSPDNIAQSKHLYDLLLEKKDKDLWQIDYFPHICQHFRLNAEAVTAFDLSAIDVSHFVKSFHV